MATPFWKGEHAKVRVKVFTHFAKPGVWNAGKYYISYIHCFLIKNDPSLIQLSLALRLIFKTSNFFGPILGTKLLISVLQRFGL